MEWDAWKIKFEKYLFLRKIKDEKYQRGARRADWTRGILRKKIGNKIWIVESNGENWPSHEDQIKTGFQE